MLFDIVVVYTIAAKCAPGAKFTNYDCLVYSDVNDNCKMIKMKTISQINKYFLGHHLGCVDMRGTNYTKEWHTTAYFGCY